MSGERFNNKNNEYGTLNMRPYVIFGNDIAAFYDKNDDLIFILDNTVNSRKPNVLLVINPDGDKKWDEILSNIYKVDLENIRPKQDNKYQKLDIEYSGLNVYDNLIKAYDNGEDLSEYLTQLDVLRDSAVRHSAMSRLNMANEIIAKTNNTIVKTKETIDELQTRLKTLRSKLASQKKEIGKISTKQSAAKILRTESQIEATNEKLKRAKKRLESAQRRLEAATNDAELASALLNLPEPKYTVSTSKAVMNSPKYEIQATEPDDDFEEEIPEYKDDFQEDIAEETDSSVKPLFDTDPNILNEDIAFKPISFDVSEPDIQQSTPVVEFEEEKQSQPEDIEEFIAPVPFEQEQSGSEEKTEDMPPVIDTQALFNLKTEDVSDSNTDSLTEEKAKSVLESMKPVSEYEENVITPVSEPIDVRPVEQFSYEPETSHVQENVIVPEVPVVHPVENNYNIPETNITETPENSTKSKFAYYFLLILLIVLSVFTLWLYQKSISDRSPMLTKKTSETMVTSEKTVVESDTALPDVVEEVVFLDEEPETIVEDTPTTQPTVEKVETEQTTDVVEKEEEPVEDAQDADVVTEEETIVETEKAPEEVFIEEDIVSENSELIDSEPIEDTVEEEVVVDKPEYDAGSKHEEMFVIEDENVEEMTSEDEDYFEEDPFYDAEEAEYQAEQESLE
ncbi:MAG: hypothetical protein IKN73_01960 [Alphaproteobacteria bacterium]|nr:hypothetical protein [Alphaproteobacteria bacterium]